MHVHLTKLLSGHSLDQKESHAIFDAVIRGELSEIEITALLVALKLNGEGPAEIAGAAQALRQGARMFPRPDYRFADIVGTGGDGAQTINISTAAAFVAAEAGLPVAKHGNRSTTGRCGAADLLECFGVRLDMSPATARHCLDETGISFLYAPHYHDGIRHAMPVRKSLAMRTVFNLLGPLANPARPPIMLVGVYEPAWCAVIAQTLDLLGCEQALVVHGLGLDEIALHGETTAARLENGRITPVRFMPADFGVQKFPLSAITGGEPEANARSIRAVLMGEGEPAHAAAVAVNAAALLMLAGIADTLVQGYELALSVLSGGRAFALLERFAEMSQQAP